MHVVAAALKVSGEGEARRDEIETIDAAFEERVIAHAAET